MNTEAVTGEGRSDSSVVRLADELLRFRQGNQDVMLMHEVYVAATLGFIRALRPHVAQSAALTQDGASRQLYLQQAIAAAMHTHEALTSAVVGAAASADVAREMATSELAIKRAGSVKPVRKLHD